MAAPELGRLIAGLLSPVEWQSVFPCRKTQTIIMPNKVALTAVMATLGSPCGTIGPSTLWFKPVRFDFQFCVPSSAVYCCPSLSLKSFRSMASAYGSLFLIFRL